MTLTEIMKACEVENKLLQTELDTPRAESKFTLSNLQITERLQITNDLIKELALHVKNLQLEVGAVMGAAGKLR